MGLERIKRIIEKPHCPEGMEEKVLAFASGEMKNRNERIATLAHIALCSYCFNLYEDYSIVEESFHEEVSDAEIAKIELAIDGDYIVPTDNPFLTQPSSVSVLGEKKSGTVAFAVPLSGGTTSIIAVRSRGGVDLEIRHHDTRARFYLVGSTGYAMEHPTDGVVRFYNVRPGRYALSPELWEFVFISIK